MSDNFDQDIASNGLSAVGLDPFAHDIRQLAAQIIEGSAFGMNATQVTVFNVPYLAASSYFARITTMLVVILPPGGSGYCCPS
jgi:hypothetical protein